MGSPAVKLKLKPFMLVLLIFTLLFLILFPLRFQNLSQSSPEDPFQVEKPKWTGVISLWDIPYVRAGKGSYLGWLNNYIRSFENQNPGVFIDVRTIDAERLAMYLHGDAGADILPDMISLGIYDQPIPEKYLTDLSFCFSQEEQLMLHDVSLTRVKSGDKLIGVPWMMGSYGLYISQAAIHNAEIETTDGSLLLDYVKLDTIARKAVDQKKSGKRTIDYYGFCTYSGFHSRPLLGMIIQNGVKIKNNEAYGLLQEWAKGELQVIPPDTVDMSYSNAFRLFTSEKRSAVLLGDSKVLYDLRNLEESGKGMEFQLFSLPLAEETGFYIDQIAAYALLKQGNEAKREFCITFLKGLLQEDVQNSLSNIGMFSVRKDLSLYNDDAQMKLLEESLNQTNTGPFGDNKVLADNLWNSFNNEGS